MAKVASTSVYHSIKEQSNLVVYHIHSMNEQKIRQAEESCLDKGLLPDSRTPGALIYRLRIQSQQPLKIITLVREPIARNISAFFEVFEYHTGMPFKEWNGNVQSLSNCFFEQLEHDFPIHWFDEEFRKMTGIDIYKTPFDPKKKYQTYSRDNIKILLLRVDMADTEKAQLIQDFLELDHFKLVSRNVGSTKEYAHLYQTFKAKKILPTSYLTQLLDSKYTRHFYSRSEIDQLYTKYKQQSRK